MRSGVTEIIRFLVCIAHWNRGSGLRIVIVNDVSVCNLSALDLEE